MGSMSPLATLLLGTVMAGWLGAAIWALVTGQRMRRAGMQAQGKLDRLTTLLASAPAAPPAPPPAPHQSPKSGLAARLARQSDDILQSEVALDAVASQQPLSPSALRCQVAGDKHARMERKKAARRRKREEASQGAFAAGLAASVLRV